MNISHLSVRSLRKSLGITLLLSLGVPAFAQDMSTTPAPANGNSAAMSASDRAIAQYIKGATDELNAYRLKLNSTPPPPHPDAVGIAKDKLARCDEILTKLKAADAGQFDPIKAQYEAARDELSQATATATRP